MALRSTSIKILRTSYRFIAFNCASCPFVFRKNQTHWAASRLCLPLTRWYSKDTTDKNPSDRSESQQKNSWEVDDCLEIFDVEKEQDKLSEKSKLLKYKVFKDEDSSIILDVEEERLFSPSKEGADGADLDEYHGLSLERGVRGVIDVDELVSFLRSQSACDLVVINIPQHLAYADHIVIVSGKSRRHNLALAEFVHKLFKKKRLPQDRVPKIEGSRKRTEWLALDLGNIILHIFDKLTREKYDLESLWAVGPEFDPHLNKDEDPLEVIISEHSRYLGDLQPAEKNG